MKKLLSFIVASLALAAMAHLAVPLLGCVGGRDNSPFVFITEPKDRSFFSMGETISFKGLVVNGDVDSESEEAIVWKDLSDPSVPGGRVLGTDIGINVSDLDDGGHSIKLSVEVLFEDGGAYGTVHNDVTVFVGDGLVVGFVWYDDNGNGIQDSNEHGAEGVRVRLLKGPNSSEIAAATTDPEGLFQFSEVPEGSYSLRVGKPHGYRFTKPDQGGDDTIDSDVNRQTRTTHLFFVESGGVVDDLGAGLKLKDTSLPSGGVEGYVWADADQDGLQDSGEMGIPDVAVHLFTSQGGLYDSMLTDSFGNYAFADVHGGDYWIVVTLSDPDNQQFTLKDEGGDDTADSDVEPDTGITEVFPVTQGQVVTDVDAGITGLQSSGGSISGRMWQDLDKNGIQDGGEPSANLITVSLIQDNQTVASLVTGSDGLYEFSGLTAGQYVIEVLPPDFFLTLQDQGNDDTVDSDFDPSTMRSPVIDLQAGQQVTNVDAGFSLTPIPNEDSSISGRMWQDQDKDGIQDAGEPGAGLITVSLLQNNQTLDSLVTGSDGLYEFSGLAAGQFVVQVSPPDFFLTLQDQGGDDTVDSDFDPNTMRSPLIDLQAGQQVTNVDAGFSLTPVP